MKQRFLKLLFSLSVISAVTACSDKKPTGKDNNNSYNKQVNISDTKKGTQIEEINLYGITIDRAMNSITVLSQSGDTVTFELPETKPNHLFAHCLIGDSVTIKYIATTKQDSVTAIFKGYKP